MTTNRDGMRIQDAFPIVIPAMRSFLFVAAGMTFAGLGGLTLEQGTAYWPVPCILVNLLTIGCLFAVCAKEKILFRELIMPERKKWKIPEILWISGLMILVGMAGMLVCSFAFYGGLPEFLVRPLPLPWAIFSLVFLPLTIVFAELPLYFGYAYDRLKNRTRRQWHAAAYVIFWYALQHSFFPLQMDFTYMLFRFLAFLPLMVLILLIYRRVRNLVPLMAGHAILDLGTGIQILIVSLTA